MPSLHDTTTKSLNTVAESCFNICNNAACLYRQEVATTIIKKVCKIFNLDLIPQVVLSDG